MRVAPFFGLSGGAEALILPSRNRSGCHLSTTAQGKDRGKLHSIVMLAEGCGNYRDYCQVKKRPGNHQGTNLGYIQKRGSPSNMDLVAGLWAIMQCLSIVERNRPR